MTMKQKPIQIDREKLRAAVRTLGNEYVFYMLDDAIELLPPAKLLKIAKKYSKRITDMLSAHYSYGRDKMLTLARRTATPVQRKALAEVKGA